MLDHFRRADLHFNSLWAQTHSPHLYLSRSRVQPWAWSFKGTWLLGPNPSLRGWAVPGPQGPILASRGSVGLQGPVPALWGREGEVPAPGPNPSALGLVQPANQSYTTHLACRAKSLSTIDLTSTFATNRRQEIALHGPLV